MEWKAAEKPRQTEMLPSSNVQMNVVLLFWPVLSLFLCDVCKHIDRDYIQVITTDIWILYRMFWSHLKPYWLWICVIVSVGIYLGESHCA